jgi:hypothetical protein
VDRHVCGKFLTDGLLGNCVKGAEEGFRDLKDEDVFLVLRVSGKLIRER